MLKYYQNKFIKMEIYDIIKKLIGPIDPIGETYEDNERFENLKATTKLVNQLLFKIYTVSYNKDKVEFSMKKSGEFAHKFLKTIKTELE